ncbi:MAG: hypothetical protein P4L55_19370 [Syntrophobacteraceae bacterium]|nr:hypothetical protein [Syntrophobacteraceae bacterium]
MDAQPTNIEPQRRTHMRQAETKWEKDLRSDMLQTEERIVEDIENLMEMFRAERVVNYLAAAAKEELALRFRALERQELEKIFSGVKEALRDRRYVLGLIGLGITGLVFYSLIPERKSGMARSVPEIAGTGRPPYSGQPVTYPLVPDSDRAGMVPPE